jgi:hypothetical protein
LTGESDTSTLLSGGHVRLGTQFSDLAEIPSGLELGAAGLVSAAFVRCEDDLWLLVPRRRGELSLASKLS